MSPSVSLAVCEFFWFFLDHSCSSIEDEEEDANVKAHREKERRQANNIRERYVQIYKKDLQKSFV